MPNQPMYDVELLRKMGVPISKADYSWMDRMDSMSPEEFMYRSALTSAVENGDPREMEAAKFYKRAWEAAQAQGNPASFSYSEPGGGYVNTSRPAASPSLPSLSMPKMPDFTAQLMQALGD